MKYVLIKTDGGVRVESDGKEIWESNGSWSPKNVELQSAILEDAGFNDTQKDAIMAVMGFYETEYE